MKKTKVLFDATVFAIAAKDTNARTGVYRVASELAFRLAYDERLEIAWSVRSKQDAQTITELVEQNRVPRRPTVILDTKIAFANRIIYFVRRKLAKLFSTPKLAVAKHTTLSRQARNAIRSFDIVYSPFYDCDPQLFRHLSVRYVLNINDLIPINYPELLPKGAADNVRKAIDNLSSEDCAICISDSTRSDLLSYKPDFPANMASTIHLAASDHFRPLQSASELADLKKRLNIPSAAKYILSVCTLEPRKNLRHVIECFSQISQEQGPIFLVLAGSSGWQNQGLLDEIPATIRERIVLSGFLPDEELPLLYSGAEFFVYMSMYEGFGLPPLEAMKCGTPVITSNNSSLPEVVGDGGIMLAPSDKHGLIEAMNAMLMNSDLRKELAIRALARSSYFSWDRCAKETADLFLRIADQSRRT